MSKVAKKRECPALGRAISAAECGGGRGSRIACPSDCTHFPFADGHSDPVEAIEKRVFEVLLDRFRAERRHLVTGLSGRGLRVPGGVEEPPGLMEVLRIARDREGLSVMQRWERAGFGELNNDERLFARALKDARFRLIEVRRVVDRMCFEGVDLLEGEAAQPRWVIDREGEARPRFSCVFGLMMDLPHYVWVLERSFDPVSAPQRDSLELMRVLVEDLGGPSEMAEWPGWLERNEARLADAYRQFTAMIGSRLIVETQEAREVGAGADSPLVESARPAIRSMVEETVAVVVEMGVTPPVEGSDVDGKAWTEQRQAAVWRLLDRPLTFLEGRTPREAALDPVLRPKVMNWVKTLMSKADRIFLDTGRDASADLLAVELSLPEIQVPSLPRNLWQGFGFGHEAVARRCVDEWLARTPVPVVFAQPTVERAWEVIQDRVRTASEARSFIGEGAVQFVEFLEGLQREGVDTMVSMVLSMTLRNLCALMKPPGREIPPIDREFTLQVQLRVLERLNSIDAEAGNDRFVGLVAGVSRQPEVLRLVLDELLRSFEVLESGSRTDDSLAADRMRAVILCTLAVDILDLVRSADAADTQS